MNFYDILLAKKLSGGGGGDITTEALNVTANGQYTAPQGKAYTPVNVNVAGYKVGEVETPTPIATFNGTDNPLKSLTASIVPVQDLHGYDSPWAGGAGKNKINLADIATASAGFVYNREPVSIAVNTYTLSFNFIGNSGSISISLRNGETVVSTLQDQSLFNGLNTYTLPILSDNADSISLYAGISGTYENFMLNEGSTALPYEPYSNICPISGWTEEVVSRTGKNLFDSNRLVTECQFNENDGVYSGSSVSLQNYLFLNKEVTEQVIMSLDYYSALDYRSGYLSIDYTDGTNSFIALHSTTWQHYEIISTADKTVKDIRFIYSNGTNVFLKNIQIEIGTSASQYEPYAGTTTTIPFTDAQGNPVEVFGGSVDVVNGLQTEDVKFYDDLKNVVFELSANGQYYWSRSTTIPYALNQSDGMCSHFEFGSNSDVFCGTTDNTGHYILFYKSKIDSALGISSVAEFNTWLANQSTNGTPVQLWYKLATPNAPIQLQPTSIKSLDGENNVFASTGDVEELKYFSK